MLAKVEGTAKGSKQEKKLLSQLAAMGYTPVRLFGEELGQRPPLEGATVRVALLPRIGGAGTGGGRPSGPVAPSESSSRFVRYGLAQALPAVPKVSLVVPTRWIPPKKSGKWIEPPACWTGFAHCGPYKLP